METNRRNLIRGAAALPAIAVAAAVPAMTAAPSASTAAWATAVRDHADAERTWQALMACEDDATYDQCHAHGVAVDGLLLTPAPTTRELLHKITLLHAEYGSFVLDQELADSLLADARRLLGEG